MTSPALYVGAVTHQRFGPTPHSLRHRVVQLVADLDDLEGLDARLRLFSLNRPNLFSVYDSDYGTGDRPIESFVRETLVQGGADTGGGRIVMQTLPRCFGFVFNPLTVFYCYGPDVRLAAMVYEVRNTFGQRHTYVLPVEAYDGGHLTQSCRKSFHVSPFMDMDMTYQFDLAPPGERVTTIVRGLGPQGHPLIHAAFHGRRRELTDAALALMLLTHPLMTFGVVAAIHIEAVKLMAKGLRLRPAPAAKPSRPRRPSGPALSGQAPSPS